MNRVDAQISTPLSEQHISKLDHISTRIFLFICKQYLLDNVRSLKVFFMYLIWKSFQNVLLCLAIICIFSVYKYDLKTMHQCILQHKQVISLSRN